jgi:hypothetical protein
MMVPGSIPRIILLLLSKKGINFEQITETEKTIQNLYSIRTGTCSACLDNLFNLSANKTAIGSGDSLSANVAGIEEAGSIMSDHIGDCTDAGELDPGNV